MKANVRKNKWKDQKRYEKTEIAKYISHIGSVRLLDVINEKDMAEMVYKKMIICYNEYGKD